MKEYQHESSSALALSAAMMVWEQVESIEVGNSMLNFTYRLPFLPSPVGIPSLGTILQVLGVINSSTASTQVRPSTDLKLTGVP
jgi:hypothetical protein